MIKEPASYASMTISVFLKDGRSYERRDTTPSPLGQSERIVCFWDGDSVVSFPLENVDRFVMHFG